MRLSRVHGQLVLSVTVSVGWIEFTTSRVVCGDHLYGCQLRGSMLYSISHALVGVVLMGLLMNSNAWFCTVLFFFFFRLFPSGVATADFPSPVVSINCIFLRHFNLSHVLFHHIHKPPFWPSPFPLSWQLHPQHPSPNIPTIFPP